MIYVFPTTERSYFVALLMWPLVWLQVLLLHPPCGFRYATKWANRSVQERSLAHRKSCSR
jgi:hypothetical protein